MNIIILLTLAGLCYGIMWHLQFRRHQWAQLMKLVTDPKWTTRTLVLPIYVEWWYVGFSWQNKYKARDHKKGSAFPGSRWLLVWLTDAFHFFQFLAELFLGYAIHATGATGPLIPYLPAWLPVWLHSTSFALAFSLVISTGFTITFRGLSYILNTKAEMQKLRQIWVDLKARVQILHMRPVQATLFYAGILTLIVLNIGWLDMLLDQLTGSDTTGGIVSVSLVVLIVVGFWWWTRRRNRKREQEYEDYLGM